MNLRLLLALLLAPIRPAVDDPANPPAAANPQDPPAEAAPEQPELDLDPADPDHEPVVDPKVELEAARKEARDNKERAERFEREAAELRTRQAPLPNDEYAREEAKLNDQNTPALEKWQIQANRELRANRSASQAALAQAHDVSDRTAYTALSMANPVAKKYEARVEEQLAKARAAGQNPSRAAILRFILGDDMLDGKFKKKAAPAAGAPDKSAINRGKLPGARSDVNAKGSQTEREKRRARLENQQI